jgi:peptidoglycan hydrolase-like protein with peptidoglycan-binding domain
MLNTMGYTVSNTGSGSVGNESSFFGPKTRFALIRFQRAFAIPTTGFFGPLSRAAMNRILNSVR